jgi:hypothetical protein
MSEDLTSQMWLCDIETADKCMVWRGSYSGGILEPGICRKRSNAMSVTIKLDLPDALVNEARAAGLLESNRLADWLVEELRRNRARGDFGLMLKKLHSVADEPMSLDEIQAEVTAVREERRRREGGR